MPQLLILIGIPGSGKSTYASKYKDLNYEYFSSDNIREELSRKKKIEQLQKEGKKITEESIEGIQDDQSVSRQAFQKMFGRTIYSLIDGKNVIYDACNTQRHDRKSFIKKMRERYQKDDLKITAVFFDIPLEVCKERNQRRNEEGSIVMDNNKKLRKVQRQVPEEVLDKMYQQLHGCPPTLEEGFDEIEIIKYNKELNKNIDK